MTEFPVVPSPAWSVRCAVCGDRVQARLEGHGASRTRYVLPVDEQGRCAACAWMDDAADEMVPTGQSLRYTPGVER